LDNRRNFLKKGLTLIAASVTGYLAIPKIVQADGPSQVVIGERQLRLFNASEQLLKRFGMLRSRSLMQFANDGEIFMDWNVIIPPENLITHEANELAKQVLNLLD